MVAVQSEIHCPLCGHANDVSNVEEEQRTVDCDGCDGSFDVNLRNRDSTWYEIYVGLRKPWADTPSDFRISHIKTQDDVDAIVEDPLTFACVICGDSTFDIDLDDEDAFPKEHDDIHHEQYHLCENCDTAITILRKDWGESGARGFLNYTFMTDDIR